jgi:hypothetical protein
VTFYFDDIKDLDWALRAWQSVRCEPGPQCKQYVN